VQHGFETIPKFIIQSYIQDNINIFRPASITRPISSALIRVHITFVCTKCSYCLPCTGSKIKLNFTPRPATTTHSFFNLHARWKWVIKTTPRSLYPRERPGTHYIGRWRGSRAVLDGCGKSRSHRASNRRPCSP
jgi:hypothetical protein